MKTVILIGALVMSFTMAQASNGAEKEKCADKKSCLHETISETINNVMVYPENVGPELEGSAHVLLLLDESGKLSPLMIQSENAELIQYITGQIEKITIDQDDVVAGETFRYKFDFKYAG